MGYLGRKYEFLIIAIFIVFDLIQFRSVVFHPVRVFYANFGVLVVCACDFISATYLLFLHTFWLIY